MIGMDIFFKKVFFPFGTLQNNFPPTRIQTLDLQLETGTLTILWILTNIRNCIGPVRSVSS